MTPGPPGAPADHAGVTRLRPRTDAGAAAMRVVLVARERLVREGLSSLLDRHGVDVVEQVDQLAGRADPRWASAADAVIVELGSPRKGDERLDLLRLRGQSPGLPVVVLADEVDLGDVRALLASTAGMAYLVRDPLTGVAALLEAVRRAVSGEAVIEPGVVRELAGTRRRRDPFSALTQRQKEILSLMAEGRSNLGISRRLLISEGTVEKHVRSIFAKLQLPEDAADHRRVLAVIAHLDSSGTVLE